VVPCRSCVNRHFGGTYCLHLQGRKIRKRGTSVSRWLQTGLRLQPPAHASFFYLEDGGSKFFLGVSLPGYMDSHPRRQYSLYSPVAGTSNLTRKNSFLIYKIILYFLFQCGHHVVLHLVLFMFSYVSSDFLHGTICVDCFNMIRFIPVVSTRPGYKFAEALILALSMCLL
jgi:hypothetical protein